jgi:hypothetical protein
MPRELFASTPNQLGKNAAELDEPADQLEKTDLASE